MKEKESYLPEKWRNKVFCFQAGGYDGCIHHPAALIVDRDGEVHLVGSDGGAGGLDEDDWYCRKCRAYLDEKGVFSEDEFLYGPKRSEKFYKEFRRLKESFSDERRRRERRLVLQTLEAECGKKPEEIPGWNHEFELIGGVGTEEEVKEVCKKVGDYFYDVYFRAEIADALRDAGYSGAGFVCTQCGGYVDGTDYESFADHVDRDSYHGIGGLAVAYTSILCDKCLQDMKCPQCGELSRRPSSEGDVAYCHMTFREAFIVQWLGVCAYCADSFWRKNRQWEDEIDGLEETIDNANAQIGKYLAIMKEAGRSEEDLKRLERENREYCEGQWRTLVNDLRERMEEDVSEFFHDADDWAGDRLGKDEHYVW